MTKRELIRRWSPPVLWMGVIFVASSLPGADLRGVSDYSFYGHFAEYAVLGALLFVAARRQWPGRVPYLFGALVASLYGVTDELHQFLTPGRTPDPLDWATDTLGAIVGIVLVVLIARTRRKARR